MYPHLTNQETEATQELNATDRAVAAALSDHGSCSTHIRRGGHAGLHFRPHPEQSLTVGNVMSVVSTAGGKSPFVDLDGRSSLFDAAQETQIPKTGCRITYKS